MKTLTLVSSLLAAAYAAPTEASTDLAFAENPLTRSTVQGEKVLPRMAASSPKDGAKRTTMKYGSYMVSSSRMMSTIKMVQGPCTLCVVTAMEATIRYPDGKEANVDTGAWLHHIALFGSGAGGGSLWAAGNERPTIRLNNEKKYGLQFPASFMLMIDLMTEDVKPKNLTLEITYEHIPLSSGYKGANMYWLTIGEPRAKTGQYKFTTLPATSTVTGSLLYAIGHMHDGGTDMRLYVNSKMVCKSVMHYNAREGYLTSGHKNKRQAGHGGHGGGAGAMHISDPGACTDFGTVNMGDRLTAEAWYDADKYGLMNHNGKNENLMGNMRVYVGGN
jgi:hypothetical protein